jgi:hypothetical protein
MKRVKSRRIEIAGRVAGLRGARNAYRILVRETSSKAATWMTGMDIAMNTSMYLRQVGFKNVRCLTVAEGRFQ